MTAAEHAERASELAAHDGQGIPDARALRAAEAQAHALAAIALVTAAAAAVRSDLGDVS